MTKFDIRVLTIGYLAIEKEDKVLDIGAGTGSISIEASLQGAHVWAIERDEQAIKLIKENDRKFKAGIKIIEGLAPKDLPREEFDKCFIGGSGGKLEEIFIYLEDHLKKNGILCANFIMMKNLNEFHMLLEKFAYKDIETHLIQASYIDRIGLLRAHNPIFIIKGVK